MPSRFRLAAQDWNARNRLFNHLLENPAQLLDQ
jgi:hypothetical protein